MSIRERQRRNTCQFVGDSEGMRVNSEDLSIPTFQNFSLLLK
jgi:hypothetical protein